MSKTCQFIFTEWLKRLGRTLRVLVEGEIRHHTEEDATVDVTGQSGYLSYVQYIRHLRSKGEVKSVLDTEDSRMELDYLDHLQSALQPCFDNLEFGTYEVCEYRKSVVDTHPSTLLFVLFLSTKHFFSSI